MKFYSGRGDKGKTSLFGSQKRYAKNNPILEALGTVDEVVSFLGLCKSLAKEKVLKQTLERVQEDLFLLQAEIGGARKIKKIASKNVRSLESAVAAYGKKVGQIKNFIVPGGKTFSAYLDYARTLARRAERKCVGLSKQVSPAALTYLNRLSSLLFVLARFVNKKNRVKEKKPRY